MLSSQERWELCLQQLKAALSPEEYTSTFANYKLFDYQDEKVRVIVPSREVFERMEKNLKLGRLFVHVVRQVFGDMTQLGFHLPPREEERKPTPSVAMPVPNTVQQRQLPPLIRN